MRGRGRKEGFIFRFEVERREKWRIDSSPVERLFCGGTDPGNSLRLSLPKPPRATHRVGDVDKVGSHSLKQVEREAEGKYLHVFADSFLSFYHPPT